MNHKIIAVIPARSDSTRLPAKHLRLVRDKPMLYYLVDRLCGVSLLDTIVVATTKRSCDDELCNVGRALGCQIYRGSLDDVTGRIAGAASAMQGTIIIRANGDNPLLAPEVIELGIAQLLAAGLGLVTGKNAYTRLPVGLGAEIITGETMAWLNEYTPPALREDVTRYVFESETPVNWQPIVVPQAWVMPEGSITVDTLDDFQYFTKLVSCLPAVKPRKWTIEMILETMEVKHV